MPLALILVDALPPSYVSQQTLPSICELAHDGYAGPLTNIYAYRGIEATLFTGLFPSEHGVWGEFRPAPPTQSKEPVLDRLARLSIAVGDLLPSDRLRIDVRYVVSRLRQPNRHLPTGNLIPASLMRRFIGSVETPIWEAGSLGKHRTIFDDLRAAGHTFEVVGYPTIQRDTQIVAHVRKRLSQGDLPDFWYIKFSALDALGHKFGPSVEKLAPALGEMNGQIKALISTLKSSYAGADLDIVLLSDHGMSQVTRMIDVRPLLRQAGLLLGRDYLYFLDSTTIRFWSEQSSVRSTLAACFSGLSGMRVLDVDARRKLHIPDDVGTGDVLVALDEGSVIFPDFFRKQGAPLGMHGYAQVETEAGNPFLAVEPEVAALLPATGPLTHADVWAAMRTRLGLVRDDKQMMNQEAIRCMSLY